MIVLFDRVKVARGALAFEVAGTLKGMSADIKFCKDNLCENKSKIFLKNENVYIDYDSDVLNQSITAVLIFPDKTTKQIILPTSIKADQIGTYNLEVSASKEGYRTIEKKEQFGAIEEDTNIEYSEPKAANNASLTNGVLYILIGIIIILIVFFIYKKKFSNKIRKI